MSWPVLVFGMALPWLLLLFACWLGMQILRQSGRILFRLEVVEQMLIQLAGGGAAPAKPESLPVGSEAPAFALADLDEKPHTLADLRGRPVLLIFFNPQCGFCGQMVPDLAALPAEGGEGRPVPVLISTGSVADNRALLDKQQLRRRVWLQKGMEVGNAYKVSGTPSAYLLDEQGRISDEMAVGAGEILSLAEPYVPEKTGAAVNGTAGASNGDCGCAKRGKVNRGLQHSRIPRDGLKAGTPAPDFRLPRLDGGDLALSDYRGRPVLLVFSDPECGPCMELVPRLEKLHREQQDLQVLLVSRREPEANRAKVREHGLTFPVLLQKSWEVSRLYAMFATPIGYLIDEQGVIVKDVATGVEPILLLASPLPAGR